MECGNFHSTTQDHKACLWLMCFLCFPFIRWWEQLWIDTCFSSFINICSNLADVVHDLQEKVWFLFGFYSSVEDDNCLGFGLFLVVLMVWFFWKKMVLVFEPFICRYHIGQECNTKSLFWEETISYQTSYITNKNLMIDIWVHESTNYASTYVFPTFIISVTTVLWGSLQTSPCSCS